MPAQVHIGSPSAGIGEGLKQEDAKRCAALRTLVQLALGPGGSFLGSAWVVVLRTLSSLQSAQVSTQEQAAQRSCKAPAEHPARTARLGAASELQGVAVQQLCPGGAFKNYLRILPGCCPCWPHMPSWHC